MDKTKHREQVKRTAHIGDFRFANQTLHQTPDTWAVLAGAGGGAGELVVMCEKRMKYKVLFSGLFFLFAGIVFLFLENTFYQYIDEEGFLHESLFLPLGTFFLIIGSLLISFFIIKILWRSLCANINKWK
jgi:hypothetical protein